MCAASAVHHDSKDHLSQASMEGNIQSTYSDSMAFTEFFVTETTKALRGTPEAFFCSALGLSPSLNCQFAFLWEIQLAAESSSRQGIGRSERKMLISMWVQQECPGIIKDCVKFSLEEPLSGEKHPPYSKRSCRET